MGRFTIKEVRDILTRACRHGGVNWADLAAAINRNEPKLNYTAERVREDLARGSMTQKRAERYVLAVFDALEVKDTSDATIAATWLLGHADRLGLIQPLDREETLALRIATELSRAGVPTRHVGTARRIVEDVLRREIGPIEVDLSA